MVRFGRCSWILVAILSLTIAESGIAQKKRPTAATNLNEADEDFALQGEYLGAILTLRAGYWYWQQIGLQVVARRDGRFDAVIYNGGLPGAAWDRKETLKLSGQREGDVLRLQSLPLTIHVHGEWADVTDTRIRSICRLSKIRRVSPTTGAVPPWNAAVLFDGSNTAMFENGRLTKDQLLMQGADTRKPYKDFTLHLEFRLPYMPNARGQGRANSGVYIQSRYEVQILDSFGLERADNECGGLYRQRKPDVNMCYPPLRWQTYDITFTSPKFDQSGNKTNNARITVRHNGVLIHEDAEVTNKTGSGQQEGPKPLPIRFQDHGNPVRFRNIWLVEHDWKRRQKHRPSIVCPPFVAGRQMHSGPFHIRVPHSSVGDRRLYKYGWAPHPRPTGSRGIRTSPTSQYWRAEYNPIAGRYQPVRDYSPVVPDRHGYWTW